MEIRFVEGDQTMGRRVLRRCMVAVPILIGTPSLAYRMQINDFRVSPIITVVLASCVCIAAMAYASQRRRTRSVLRAFGSQQFLYGHGNIFRLKMELGEHGEEGDFGSKSHYESRLLVMLDTEPPLVVAIPGWGMSDGRIKLSDDAAVTAWHQGDRLRSLEISVAGRVGLVEGRGQVPDWAALGR